MDVQLKESSQTKPVPLHCPRGQQAYCWDLLKALAGACPQCQRCVEEAKARGVIKHGE